jgi:hypothetical protein
VQRQIFEDAEGYASDDNHQEGGEMLKKRRKKYQDLEEYLNIDGARPVTEMRY